VYLAAHVEFSEHLANDNGIVVGGIFYPLDNYGVAWTYGGFAVVAQGKVVVKAVATGNF
jgi:hypothetical protein